MTSAPDASLTPKPRASWREGWAVYLQCRVLIVLLILLLAPLLTYDRLQRRQLEARG